MINCNYPLLGGIISILSNNEYRFIVESNPASSFDRITDALLYVKVDTMNQGSQDGDLFSIFAL